MKSSFSKQILEIKRFFSPLKGKQLMYWSGLISAIILSSVTQVLYAYITKGVLNAVTTSNRELLKHTAILALIYVFLEIIHPLTNYIHITAVRYIMYDLKSKLFRHMESLDITYFERHHSGDSIERLSNNVDELKAAYFLQVLWLLGCLCTGITSIVTMFVLEWRIALILLLLGFASIKISVRYTLQIRGFTDKVNKGTSGLTQRLSDVLAGFDVIKMFKGAILAINKYKDQNDLVTNLRMQSSRKKAEQDGMGFAFSFLSSIGIMILGAIMAGKGLTDLGTVASIVTLQGSAIWMFQNLGNMYSRLHEYMSNANRVFELLDEVSEAETFHTEESTDRTSMIGFENLCFGYENREGVINNLSLSIKKGQRAALVGPSGGGKSTVLKLLLGFYPISSGSITINGKTIREYNIKTLRNMISYVPQDAYLFNGTIMENIRFGRLDATEEEVIEAAKAAYAHDFIQKLPEGYNTEMINGGSNLSGGQRQRIAIARAFLKDAPILLLDEATSALDTESENQVKISLEALMKNRTTLAVAHRLSTIENSDVIFVIENGTVVEQGTNSELIEKAGLYMRLSNVS